MPITVKLTYDNYVLHYEFTDPWDIPDLIAAFEEERRLRESMDHTLHSIIDFSQTHTLPRNWLQARHGPGLSHAKTGEMVCVGLSSGLKMMIDIIMRLANFKRMKLLATLEEAHAYIVPLVEQTKLSQQLSKAPHQSEDTPKD